MEHTSVKIGAVGPNQGSDFRINLDLTKQIRVAKRTVELALENWLEVDLLRATVVKANG